MKKKNKDYTPIEMDYDVISSADVNRMTELHSHGYDTPISAICFPFYRKQFYFSSLIKRFSEVHCCG